MKTKKLSNKIFPAFSGLICAVTCSLFCLLETSSVLSDDLSLKSLVTSRVLVLGDSITYGGQYVADLETYLR
ncbi:MAG: lysophospholipase, partial [Verrucomicrobia bacterium]|nr:lysophospholipase [Verrucomicrobiota bacterium]